MWTRSTDPVLSHTTCADCGRKQTMSRGSRVAPKERKTQARANVPRAPWCVKQSPRVPELAAKEANKGYKWQETERDEREVRSAAMRGERICKVLDNPYRKYQNWTPLLPSGLRTKLIYSFGPRLDEPTQVLGRESLTQAKHRIQPTMEGQTQTVAPQSSPVGPAGTLGPVGPVENRVEERSVEPSLKHEGL
ncbi:ankyrin-3 [Aspergillus udagawae]|nr:ankyrin-3 [Aspergillus udagawae]